MTHSSEESLTFVSEFQMNLLKLWDPQLVLVIGDIAFERIAIKYQELRKTNENLPSIPFLFCNVYQDLLANPNYTDYFPTKERGALMSGINIQEPYQKKIDLLLQMNPQSTAIAIVFDALHSNKYQIAYLDNLIKSNTLNTTSLPIEVHRVTLFSQFQQKMKSLKEEKKSIIVMNARKLYTDLYLNVTVLPHIISEWVLANVDANVLGPINQGFAIEVIKKKTLFFSIL